MRTQEEIKEAIERLKQNKEKSLCYNKFGHDCHSNLDAMINVLEENLSEDEIEEEYDGAELLHALSILDFLKDPEENIEDYLYPEIK